MSQFENESVDAKEGSGFTPVPPNLYLAKCVGLILLGTVENNFQGKISKSEKLVLRFECLGTDKGDGTPWVHDEEYTNSVKAGSNLGDMLAGWSGAPIAAGFNLVKLIGAVGQMNLVGKTSASGKKRSEIAGMTKILEGTPIPESKVAPILFNYNPPFKSEVFNSLSKFLQDKIKTSDEYQKLATAAPTGQHFAAPAAGIAPAPTGGAPF
jgi:hypothetical protein